MTLRQREPRHRDDRHLAFVRAAGCVVCPKGVNRPIEAAHIRMKCDAIGKRETGMAEKPGDQWTVGLCDYHHRIGILAQHKMNEADFWVMHGRNPFEIAARLWVKSGGAARALEPRRVKQPTPIPERKPREQRAKMQSKSSWPAGRKILNRPFERRPA